METVINTEELIELSEKFTDLLRRANAATISICDSISIPVYIVKPEPYGIAFIDSFRTQLRWFENIIDELEESEKRIKEIIN